LFAEVDSAADSVHAGHERVEAAGQSYRIVPVRASMCTRAKAMTSLRGGRTVLDVMGHVRATAADGAPDPDGR
jgi:hypothetical protein